MANIQPILDHIVILVPHTTLLNLPPWLTKAFTVLEGGRHADGVTENKLILFQDGVYLELIAFIPGKEPERQAHRWGQRREGHIVDWANTLLPSSSSSGGGGGGGLDDDLAAIRRRVAAAGSGITYSDPVSGGRLRPDGVELKWTISAPQIDDEDPAGIGGFVGGEASFWCLDRTPRELRVPYTVEGNVKHPSGAVGVAAVRVSVRDARLFETLRKTYDALQGHEGRKLESRDEDAVASYVWDLLVPETVGGAAGESIQRVLVLSHVPEGRNKRAPEVYVGIDLVGPSDGSVSGHLGDDNWVIEFNLEA